MKIAIYSGSIPAPLYIENLILAVAGENFNIYIFGKKYSSINYDNKNIFFFSTPKNKLLLVGFIFYQKLFLIFTKPLSYLKLFKFYYRLCRMEKVRFFDWWGKILPVVNNLPDIFHIQWAKALPQWFFLKELFEVKIILSLRGSHIHYSPLADDYLRKKYIDFFPKLDAFHAVSKAIGKQAIKYGANRKNIHVKFY